MKLTLTLTADDSDHSHTSSHVQWPIIYFNPQTYLSSVLSELSNRLEYLLAFKQDLHQPPRRPTRTYKRKSLKP